MSLCMSEHWIGHSRISGEDIMRLCIRPDGHEDPHEDEAGESWTDSHAPSSDGTQETP